MKHYTTLRELSEKSGINYHTLRRRLEKRQIATGRVGRVIIIKKSDAHRVVKC